MEKNENRVTIEWEDLRERVLSLQAGSRKGFKRAANATKAKKCVNPDYSRAQWAGFSKGELQDWLQHGYQSSELKGFDTFLPPIREESRMVIAEEGDEMLLDLALDGEDEYMLDWTKTESIPGLAIDAEIGMVCTTGHRILGQYFTWLNRAVTALELHGIDCQITIRHKADSGMVQEAASSPRTTVIRVKKENERSDFTAWSPMVSPASFRGLTFVAMCMHADQVGMTITSGMGRRNGGSWNVKYERETGTIHLDCPYSPSSFPEDEMTAKLKAVLDEIKGS